MVGFILSKVYQQKVLFVLLGIACLLLLFLVSAVAGFKNYYAWTRYHNLILSCKALPAKLGSDLTLSHTKSQMQLTTHRCVY